MSTKAKIKVIKKGEPKVQIEPQTVNKNNAKHAAREMVSTVSNWVSDFQNRRREETKQAFEKFFPTQPQADGV